MADARELVLGALWRGVRVGQDCPEALVWFQGCAPANSDCVHILWVRRWSIPPAQWRILVFFLQRIPPNLCRNNPLLGSCDLIKQTIPLNPMPGIVIRKSLLRLTSWNLLQCLALRSNPPFTCWLIRVLEEYFSLLQVRCFHSCATWDKSFPTTGCLDLNSVLVHCHLPT